MKKPKHSYHHGDLRAALIQETERMIGENQLDQVTLGQLGKNLGVARSAPYRHFENKNDLLCEVAVRAFSRMRDAHRAIRLDDNLSFEDKLSATAHAYFRLAVEQPDYYRLMYREGLVGENESPALKAIREKVLAELVMLLQEGQQQGRIGCGDPEIQALFCWAPFHGMASFVIDDHLPAELFQSMLDWSIESVIKGLQRD